MTMTQNGHDSDTTTDEAPDDTGYDPDIETGMEVDTTKAPGRGRPGRIARRPAAEAERTGRRPIRKDSKRPSVEIDPDDREVLRSIADLMDLTIPETLKLCIRAGQEKTAGRKKRTPQNIIDELFS